RGNTGESFARSLARNTNERTYSERCAMKSGFTRLLAFYFGYSRWIVIASMTTGVLAGITSASLIALIAVFVANPQRPTLQFVLTFVGLSLFDMAAVFVANMLSVRLSQ